MFGSRQAPSGYEGVIDRRRPRSLTLINSFPLQKKQVAALPPLRPLALIAKAVLKEAGLNQVFTGGLSSYCTTLMVIAHLQEEAAEADAAAAKAEASALTSSGAPSSSSYALHYHRLVDMGHLLLSFFTRFGKSFDYERQAVRVSKGGVRPKPASWVLPDKPRYLLSVEDPQEQGKDIGSGTFNVMAVRECFSRAADALSAVLERDQRFGKGAKAPFSRVTVRFWAQTPPKPAARPS